MDCHSYSAVALPQSVGTCPPGALTVYWYFSPQVATYAVAKEYLTSGQLAFDGKEELSTGTFSMFNDTLILKDPFFLQEA